MGSCIVLKKIPGALSRQALSKCGRITASAISLITMVNVRFSVAISKSDRMASPRRTELKPSHQWVASRSANGVGSIPPPLRTKSASPVKSLNRRSAFDTVG